MVAVARSDDLTCGGNQAALTPTGNSEQLCSTESTMRTGMSVLSKSNTAASNTVLSKWPGMVEESAQSVPMEWQSLRPPPVTEAPG